MDLMKYLYFLGDYFFTLNFKSMHSSMVLLKLCEKDARINRIVPSVPDLYRN